MPPIDDIFFTPEGRVCAESATAAHTMSAQTNWSVFMGATIHGTMRPHEPCGPRQIVRHDGARVFHLGGLVPADFWVSPEPRLLAVGTELDPQRVPGGRHRRHVLQQSVRGPQLCRGAVSGREPADRGRGDDFAVLDAVVLAV